MQLNQFDPAAFLRDVWQKQPVLFRNPWAAWANPISADELAGLACEADIEARLVIQSPGRWKVEHGPFRGARFTKLGGKPWTLLVQAVDHHVPEVAALLEPFRFVPNWRIDDVMVSYASDGGGVGPHFDQYDVFLIQGLGKRRWQVGGVCDAATPCLPHDDLRLLAEFKVLDEWVLEPGDILYVPPGVSHNGIAVGDDCMTYSVGFRAPARSELIAHWCDDALADLADDDRYQDADLQAQGNPGEIAAPALSSLYAMMAEKLLNRAAFARWFGQYSSTRKYPDVNWSPQKAMTIESLRERSASGLPICRNPASRFAFLRPDEGEILLFVDGESFECRGPAAAFAEEICRQDNVTLDAGWIASPAATDVILALCNQGSIAFDDQIERP